MSRNGSGTYTLPAGNPVVTGTTISSTWANNTLTDIATALTGSVSADGQTPITGALNMATNNINNVGTLTALTGILTNDASISGLTVGKGAGSDSGSTVLGNGALAGLNTGANNLAIGKNTLAVNTSGAQNTGLGYATLNANTSGADNVGIGHIALYGNTTGSNNVAVGRQALQANTTASNNTAVGYQAGYTNTAGAANTFVGYQAGYTSNGTNGYNTCVGRIAGYNLTTGYYNTLIGAGAGNGLTTGASNTFIGPTGTYASGEAVTTGSKNTIVGAFSGNNGGLDIRTASNYIVLSDGDGNPRGVFDSSGNLLVGTTSTVASGGFRVVKDYDAANCASIDIGHITGSASGNRYATFAYAGSNIGSITQAGTTGVLYNVTSDYRLKSDVTPIQNALSTVKALNPVNFTWVDGRKDDGFLAHELQSVLPNCVTGEKDAVNEDGTPKYQQMDNSGVIPFLVKAIQELNAKLEAQASLITTMQAKLKDAGVLGF
jgi:hypothetical protein